ncbi:MAG: hypothetical protein ABJL44_06005 [Algibacter sp.]
MKQNKIHNIKETGFKVPKDYFKNLEDVILSDIKLKSTTDDSGFKAPEDYFNTLERKILDKISENDNPKVIPLFSKKNLIYISSIAAAVLLLFNLSIFEKELTWDDLDINTVENYIINENIGTYDIASLLINEELKEEDFINYSLNDEHLETYLMDNLDIENLIIE